MHRREGEPDGAERDDKRAVLRCEAAAAQGDRCERADREVCLAVVGQDAPAPGKELIPVAGAGLRLLFSRDGADLRRRLLMTLIRDDRLHTDDVRALVGLLGRTFGPGRLAGGLLQRLNPLAAA